MALRKNKIDVALDLQQQAISKLEQFNKDFGNSVTRLAGILESATPGGPQAGGQAGQLGPNASIGTGGMFTNVTPARQAGQPSDWNKATLLNAGSASMPPGDISQGPGFEQDYIEATKRIGEGIPTSLRQALGYYGEGQLSINPFTPFSTNPENSGFNDLISQQGYSLGGLRDKQYRQNLATRANSALFNLQATKAMTMNMMGKYTGFFGGIQAIGNAGYDVNANASRSGFMGSQLFSGSFWHGLSENLWQPALSSDFGLDPSYSFGQAQQARQAINAYGWGSGNEGNWLANVLKQNTVDYGLDPQSQMAFLDPMLRWGGTSFQNLNATLANIPAAATAAGYNLKQFTQELVATANQVAQQTGATPGQAAATINALSATTGLSPQQAGSMDTIQNALMAQGVTGKSAGSILYGDQSQALLARPMTIYNELLKGQGWSSAQQFYKAFNQGNPKAQQDMTYLNMFYQNNPGALNNIQPQQAMHMLTQAGSLHALLNQTHILAALQHPNQTILRGLTGSAQHQLGEVDTRLEGYLRRYFPDNPSRTEDILKKFAQAAPHMRTPQELAAKASQLLESYAPHDRRKVAQQIGLTPEARKLVTLMQADAAHANSGGVTGFARSAGGLFANAFTGNWGGALSDAGTIASDLNPF